MKKDKEALAIPVKYEFEMFAFLYGELAKRKQTKVGTGSDPEEDAFLESFLLHARVLRDFFWNKRDRTPRKIKCPNCDHAFELSPRKTDDVLALDVVDGWHQKESAYLKTLRIPLNKLLAHLTREREKYTIHAYNWDPERIHKEIQPVIDEFRERLPSDLKTHLL